MIDHRPLSEWVTRVRLGPDDVARTIPHLTLNDGDERADARGLSEFGAPWRRSAVRFQDTGPERLVLGLEREDGSAVVVELDDLARPMPVSAEVVRLVERYEREWPRPVPREGDIGLLRQAPLALRFALLTRLDAEGIPSAELFAILPWERLAAMAREVAAALADRAGHSTLELGHWFTVTGSRFTAALEQLNAGMRMADPVVVHVAATALCDRLLDLDPLIVPGEAIQALVDLVGELATRDPLRGFRARRLIGHLKSGTEVTELSTGRLSSVFPDAAGPRDARRATEETLGFGPLRVDVVVNRFGALGVIAELALDEAGRERVTRDYGTPFVRFTIVEPESRTGYILPLRRGPSGFEGAVRFPAPVAFTVEVDDLPRGIVESAAWDAEDIARSFRVADPPGRALWRELASGLPDGHPVVRGIA